MVRVSSQPACLEGRNVPDFSSVCSPAQREQWPFVIGRWFTGNHPSSCELTVARLTAKTESGYKRKSQGFHHETIRSEGLTEVNTVKANSPMSWYKQIPTFWPGNPHAYQSSYGSPVFVTGKVCALRKERTHSQWTVPTGSKEGNLVQCWRTRSGLNAHCLCAERVPSTNW